MHGQAPAAAYCQAKVARTTVDIFVEMKQINDVCHRSKRRTGQTTLDIEILAYCQVGIGTRVFYQVSNAGEA